MLAALLLILKITGILLLSILGFLLLMVLIVLFVPVRYKIVVKRTGLDGDPPVNAQIRVTWLLHMLNIHVDYPSEVWLRVRLFIFTLIRMPDKKKDAKKKDTKKKRTKNKSTDKKRKEEAAGDGAEADGNGEPVLEESPKKEQDDGSPARPGSGATEGGTSSGESPDQGEKEPKKNILHTIRAFYDKIIGIIQKIRDKVVHIEETLQSAKDNVEFYRGVMESRAFKDSLHLAFGQLAGVLKSIGPKKCRIFVEEGMGDPATTASVLAIYGILYPLLYDKVTVIGNFEEQIIRADVLIKGRITPARILYAGVRIYFNKQVKKLIRMLKKEAKS